MPSPSGYTAILDGYNIIKRHPQWAKAALAQAREQLVAQAAGRRWPLPVAKVITVFDSREPAAGLNRQHGPVRVQFAASADAAIQELIRTAPHPERLLIVSDDREILATARAYGASCHSSAWFAQPSSPAAGPARAGQGEPKADLPAAQARAITEELARRWLKPKPKPPAR